MTEIPTYHLKTRLWIEGQSGTFLAEGRVQLLEAIGQLGSINKAAKSKGMSYKKAWHMVNTMNSEAKNPLVIRNSGGNNGGGTSLTEEGERLIKAYNTLNEKCRTFMDKEFKALKL